MPWQKLNLPLQTRQKIQLPYNPSGWRKVKHSGTCALLCSSKLRYSARVLFLLFIAVSAIAEGTRTAALNLAPASSTDRYQLASSGYPCKPAKNHRFSNLPQEKTGSNRFFLKNAIQNTQHATNKLHLSLLSRVNPIRAEKLTNSRTFANQSETAQAII